nr:MAG TPA: hypothetical protein [Caudoviricetes sp.]
MQTSTQHGITSNHLLNSDTCRNFYFINDSINNSTFPTRVGIYKPCD